MTGHQAAGITVASLICWAVIITAALNIIGAIA